MPLNDATPKLLHILHAAKDFRIASEVLEARFGSEIFPLRSTVVTAAFSVELYLKYLIARAGDPIPREHDILGLFAAAPAEAKAQLAQSFPGDVDEVLTRHRHVFLEWRYIFERQTQTASLDFKSLRDLVSALQGVAESRV